MPIIESLLDTDFYKFPMGQMVFHKYRGVPVKFALANRTKGVRLSDYIFEERLREELDHVRTLRFSESDLHYLRGTNEYSDRMFKEDYLDFLRNFRFPEYHLEKGDEDFILTFSGRWSDVTYWEIPALAIINQLYTEALMKTMTAFERDAAYADATLRLRNKMDYFLEAEKEGIRVTFSDFGTRRRHSRIWQEYIIRALKEEKYKKHFIGTSNVLHALNYSCMPVGTSAHELFMGMAGIMYGSDDEIRASHNQVFRDWWDEYGWGLSIALTDTYGSDFAFSDMGYWVARDWKGTRQDSGDPFLYGEKAIAYYKRFGIDPREKICVFSDGLNHHAMYELAKYFKDRLKVTFGWGTLLTNDFYFYRPLSIVIKLVESNGNGIVKLSDNIAKAVGHPEHIKRFMKIFRYASNFYQECKT